MAWCERDVVENDKWHDDDIMALCEGDVVEDDNCYTCITLYHIDEGGVRKQIETGRHEESRYSNPFICSYVYVPSVIPVPE
ncbi:hypothetical protein AtEden1_Chr4g0277321 [Arabidopsis thaliana]